MNFNSALDAFIDYKVDTDLSYETLFPIEDTYYDSSFAPSSFSDAFDFPVWDGDTTNAIDTTDSSSGSAQNWDTLVTVQTSTDADDATSSDESKDTRDSEQRRLRPWALVRSLAMKKIKDTASIALESSPEYRGNVIQPTNLSQRPTPLVVRPAHSKLLPPARPKRLPIVLPKHFRSAADSDQDDSDSDDGEYRPSPGPSPYRNASPYSRRTLVSTPKSRDRFSSSTSSSSPSPSPPRAKGVRSSRGAPPSRNKQAAPDQLEAIRSSLLCDKSGSGSLDCPVPGCSYRQRNGRMPDWRRHVRTHDRQHGEVRCKGVRSEDAHRFSNISPDEVPYEIPGQTGFWVGGCNKTFSRADALKRHLNNTACEGYH